MIVTLDPKKPHQKYYLEDGSVVPGASTIAKIGPSFDNPLLTWAYNCGLRGEDFNAIRDLAGSIGTVAHAKVEAHLKEDTLVTPFHAEDAINKAHIAFSNWLSWWSTAEIDPVTTEIQMTSELYKFGGTTDLVGRRKTDLVICDWKTSNSLRVNNLIQTAGYAQLWNETHEEQIISLIVLRIGKEVVGDFEVLEAPLAEFPQFTKSFICNVATYYAYKDAEKAFKALRPVNKRAPRKSKK